jgi:hypothetical protein
MRGSTHISQNSQRKEATKEALLRQSAQGPASLGTNKLSAGHGRASLPLNVERADRSKLKHKQA